MKKNHDKRSETCAKVVHQCAIVPCMAMGSETKFQTFVLIWLHNWENVMHTDWRKQFINTYSRSRSIRICFSQLTPDIFFFSFVRIVHNFETSLFELHRHHCIWWEEMNIASWETSHINSARRIGLGCTLFPRFIWQYSSRKSNTFLDLGDLIFYGSLCQQTFLDTHNCDLPVSPNTGSGMPEPQNLLETASWNTETGNNKNRGYFGLWNLTRDRVTHQLLQTGPWQISAPVLDGKPWVMKLAKTVHSPA